MRQSTVVGVGMTFWSTICLYASTRGAACHLTARVEISCSYSSAEGAGEVELNRLSCSIALRYGVGSGAGAGPSAEGADVGEVDGARGDGARSPRRAEGEGGSISCDVVDVELCRRGRESGLRDERKEKEEGRPRAELELNAHTAYRVKHHVSVRQVWPFTRTLRRCDDRLWRVLTVLMVG